MAENPAAKMPVDTAAPVRRYYKMQLRGWTSFDPSRMELSEIAERIEGGTGFLTAIEVISAADNLQAIDDADVRQIFENIIAAERILAKMDELPKAIKDRLHAALSRQAEDPIAALQPKR
jgi:hypothetical protein